jgi:hypothetical protein
MDQLIRDNILVLFDMYDKEKRFKDSESETSTD